MESQKFAFPKDFLWGAATSAHQVEGDNHNDWTEWEKKGHFISGRACDHYNGFREDFDIAKSLGHNAHRFSIEWSRIEPEEGKFDEREIEHYREVIAALRERGMESFVTLWHWTLPLWVRDKGGVASREFTDMFERYTKRVAEALGDQVRFWITINEPMVWAGHAYVKGVWPPQEKSLMRYVAVLSHLARAHRVAYQVIKRKSPVAQIGFAKNNISFEGVSFFDKKIAHIADWWWNKRFLNTVGDTLDFIGLNYYFHNRIKGFRFNQNENRETSDMGWEIYPEGIFHVLKDLKKYQKSIYITENGVADARDIHREAFIREHVRGMAKAMQEGVDVRGYFHWSLLDNFEWDKGFLPRFGLVEMNYETMERKIRPSAYAYSRIIKEYSS